MPRKQGTKDHSLKGTYPQPADIPINITKSLGKIMQVITGEPSFIDDIWQRLNKKFDIEISKQTVTTGLRELEKHGYVILSRPNFNFSFKRYSISRKGEDLLDQIVEWEFNSPWAVFRRKRAEEAEAARLQKEKRRATLLAKDRHEQMGFDWDDARVDY